MKTVLSLARVIRQFRGETGMTFAEDSAEVAHYEYPRNPTELVRLLEAVRQWLPQVGMSQIAVESHGEVYTVNAAEPFDPASVKPFPTEGRTTGQLRRLYWKYEDGPEGAETANPNDVGPAWLDSPEGVSEPVADGEWITRAEARRLASAHGYALEEDE